MPKLLARYNISFLDALGRPPLVLPYEFFQSLQVSVDFMKICQHFAGAMVQDTSSLRQEGIQIPTGIVVG
jgi:hypothetical protein